MNSKLGKGIFFGLLLSLPFWIALLCAVEAYGADEPAAPQHVLKSWVHVVGCPHTSKVIGQNNVVLIFADGESVSLDLNKMDDEKRDNLKEFIGNIVGYTFVAKCEMAT